MHCPAELGTWENREKYRPPLLVTACLSDPLVIFSQMTHHSIEKCLLYPGRRNSLLHDVHTSGYSWRTKHLFFSGRIRTPDSTSHRWLFCTFFQSLKIVKYKTAEVIPLSKVLRLDSLDHVSGENQKCSVLNSAFSLEKDCGSEDPASVMQRHCIAE